MLLILARADMDELKDTVDTPTGAVTILRPGAAAKLSSKRPAEYLLRGASNLQNEARSCGLTMEFFSEIFPTTLNHTEGGSYRVSGYVSYKSINSYGTPGRGHDAGNDYSYIWGGEE